MSRQFVAVENRREQLAREVAPVVDQGTGGMPTFAWACLFSRWLQQRISDLDEADYRRRRLGLAETDDTV
jgi:hypothetical protein